MRNDNFLAKAQKLSILPTLLNIFDIRQHNIRFLYKHGSYTVDLLADLHIHLLWLNRPESKRSCVTTHARSLPTGHFDP